MAFDAFFLTAVLDEIRTTVPAGSRVEKIHQPSRDTVILLLKTQEGRQKLMFVANPTAPRLHLTATSPENPAEPPMFCMLLRKHLSGARLNSISQPRSSLHVHHDEWGLDTEAQASGVRSQGEDQG